MRKVYTGFLCLLSFIFTNISSNAQVNTYIFTSTAGAYTPITGGTLVANATAATGAGALDDVNYPQPAGSIPFNFTFNGVVYTSFNINSNGYITFGATPPPAGFPYTPISDATAYAGAVSGFGNDIRGVYATTADRTTASNQLTNVANVGLIQVGDVISGTGITAGTTVSAIAGNVITMSAAATSTGTAGTVTFITGELRYETIGSAPNRILVIQYSRFQRYATSNSSFSFQIRLTEAGGISTSQGVNIVYGPVIPSAATTYQVGLRGASNADFNNRTTTTDWAATTPGATNTATNTLSPTVFPASGLTYSWVPPPPCVPGSLGGGTTQGPAGAVCPGTSFTLSVTGASFGSGLTYLWESSNDGSLWGTTGVTTQTLTTSTLTNMYYRRKMTCSGVDAYSTALLITVSAPLALPLTEGFNTSGTAVFPTCWTQQFVVGAGNITFQTSSTNPTTVPFEGTRFVWWNSYSIGNNNETRLVTPAIVTTGTASVNVEFYWNNDNRTVYSTGQYLLEGVQVQYSLNGTTWVDAGSFIPRHDPSLVAGTNQWKLKKVTLPAAAGNQPSILIGFKFHSSFGDNCSMDAVNILATPPCVEPSALNATNITTTSATLNWTASPSAPTGGYQWELRTSGAAGSGATGLVASGTTTTLVTTANVASLTANTTYTLYVRSDCGGGTFSVWSPGFAFNTLCNAVTTFPFTETFENASPSRSCWTTSLVSGTVNWTYGAGAGNGGNITTAHGGTVNARHYGANSGSVARLISPALNFSAMPAQGAQVTFWYANQNWLGDQNQLRIYYKTSAAGAWTLIPGAVYTTDVGVWTEVELMLPSSVGPTDYYIAFEGTELFGWGVAVDDVTIAVAPTCPKPTAVTALGISPTEAVVNFTSPGNAFIVEYGAPGFTPGTDNTPGVGGTLVFGASSPISVGTSPQTPLTPNTTYDFYVRRICIPGVDYSVNVKATATTLCNAVNIPYLQNFESATPPAGFPTCTSMQDVNGNSGPDGNVTGGRWTTFTGTSTQTYVSPTKVLRYLYDLPNPARGADDWFYLQGLNLTSGTTYRLKFFYKGSDGPTWIERLEVKYGTSAQASAMTNLLYTNNNIATAIASPWDSAIVDFSPAASGVYYIGFHAMSLPDQAFLYVDDISVKVAPLVDVGVTGLTLPSLNCPTNGVFVQATVTNYNTTTLNFATYPVTVTANITGAGTGTLTALINSGSLAAGASMSVYLNPSFNFSAGGIYNITATTSTNPASNDPETGNDSYTTSVNVNPNPAVPVISPVSPAICAGTPILLSTQFTASPPPVSVPITSGTITVSIPDNSPAGVSHTIAVSTIPAGATVTGLSVTIDKIAHTYVGDLIINLKAPNNKILNLFNQRGAGGDSLISTTISSTATQSLAVGAAPFTGTYLPDANAANAPTGFGQTVASFPLLYAGLPGNGNWTLAIRDNAGLDVGILRGWTLTITYQILTPTITWTPVTGLYTNAGATTAYTAGSNAYSLYANPAATTTYTVTATTVAGCTSSASTTVTVNPYPVVTIGSIPDTVCISDPLIALLATPVGGSWSGVGVSGTNFVPPATAVGTYILSYSYTNAFGCTTTSTKKIVVKDCPERLILLRDNALLLYPNPNNGQFNIRINSVLYNNLVMKVYTNTGVLVKTQQLGGLAWGRVVPIDLTNLPGGVYMVKFYYDGGARTAEKTFKVIIGHE